MKELNPPAIVRTAEDNLAFLARQINSEHRAGFGAMRKGLEHFRAAGEALIKAKKQVGHGKWGDWLKENVRCSQDMCNRYMRLARNWDRDKLRTTRSLSEAMGLITNKDSEEAEAENEGAEGVEDEGAQEGPEDEGAQDETEPQQDQQENETTPEPGPPDGTGQQPPLPEPKDADDDTDEDEPEDKPEPPPPPPPPEDWPKAGEGDADDEADQPEPEPVPEPELPQYVRDMTGRIEAEAGRLKTV
jgi:hypothetical protein